MVDQLAAEPREAPVVLGRAVGERVAAVPGEARHPHAQLVEDVCRPGLDPEALHPLEREQEPDPLAPLDGVEIVRAPHLDDAVVVLAQRTVEGGDHGQRLAERPLGLHRDVDVDRAHLQADTAALEERQPGLGEDVRLPEPALPVGELHEQVDVGVGDHRHDPIPGEALRAGRGNPNGVRSRYHPCPQPPTQGDR